MDGDTPLTAAGYRLRNAIAEAGVELTPQELADGLAEAAERIQPGPDGTCRICHHDGSDGRDFRFGICDVCAFCSEPGCCRFATNWGGRCLPHGGRPHTLGQWWRWLQYTMTGRDPLYG